MKRLKLFNIKFLALTLIVFSLFLISFADNALALTMPGFSHHQTILSSNNAPTAVAIGPDGKIYVTESTKNRVIVYEQDGTNPLTVTGFFKPNGIAVDDNGNVYVGNVTTQNVEVYDSDFNLIRKLGSGDGEVTEPNAIAIHSVTDKIYVADSDNDIVKVSGLRKSLHLMDSLIFLRL
jgi:DNA-binding beta-propeller fold protein YncE